MSLASAPFIKYPSRKEYVPSYRLSDLFDDDVLFDKLTLAKHRTLMAFDYASHWVHGRRRQTDNFIVGVGPRHKHLVEHIIDQIIIGKRKHIVVVNDLPECVDGNVARLKAIARDAERQLLAACISIMVDDERTIWFEEHVPGTWNVLQSTMDQYRQNKLVIAKAKRIDATSRRERLHGGGRLRVVH